MNRQFFLERECIHRGNVSEGYTYNGMLFVQALEHLQSDEALKMAAKISPFYWVDAPRVLIWLCKECATELGMAESPRAIVQSARR